MRFKLYFFLVLFLVNINVFANEKIFVTLDKCVDGDTTWINIKNERIKIRFLGIDTPEKKEKYGDVASEFTCSALKNSFEIMIEYDSKSEKKDLYDRHLVWVFVDGELLQNKIIKNGLGKVAYIYNDYKYVNELYDAEDYAKKNQLRIWENEKNEINYLGYLALFIAIILSLITPKSYRKFKKYYQKIPKLKNLK